MRKCLVTGASGFLGREVTSRLAEEYAVTGVACQHAKPHHVKTDLREPTVLKSLLKNLEPDIVVHTAAYREPDYCEEHPEEANRLNVGAVQTLCDELNEDVPLVFVSSDYVFDGENPPYDEESPCQPVNIYGQQKVEAERCVSDRKNGIIVRVAVLVGAGNSLDESGFIAQLHRAAVSPDPLSLDNTFIRFPTWTRDVAHAIAYLLDNRHQGIFHVSGPRGGSRYSLAVEMARLLGVPDAHISATRGVPSQKATRPPNTQLATDKLRALGYSRFTDFTEVARQVLAAFE